MAAHPRHPEPLVVAFVPGVTPGKWERVWRERRPGGRLELRPLVQDAALAALADRSVHMALVRDTSSDERWHAIPLYRERPVVVAPRGSLGASLDEVDLIDLEGEDVLAADLTHGDGAEAVELVAANVGVVVLPQAVARALSRRDVVARPLRDAPDTGVALVWPVASPHPLADVFIGIVRGRTANSSR
jgi:DNA-binding transcriptional LysR family regulator